MHGRNATWVAVAGYWLAIVACSSQNRPGAKEWEECAAGHRCTAGNGGAGGAGQSSGTVDVGAAGGDADCKPDPQNGVTWKGDVQLGIDLALQAASVADFIEGGTVVIEFPGSTCGFASTVFDPSSAPQWELSGMASKDDFLRVRPTKVPGAAYDLLVAAHVSGDADITGSLILPRTDVIDRIYEETGVTRDEDSATILGWVLNADTFTYSTFIAAPQGLVAYLETTGWSKDGEHLTGMGYFAVLNVPAEPHPGTALTLNGTQLDANGEVWVESTYEARVEDGAVTWLPVSVTDYR